MNNFIVMKYMNKSIYCFALAVLIACNGRNTPSNVEAPGAEKNVKSKALEAGADLLQNKSPISKINVYLNGFHFYNGNINAQMEAHHYISQLNEDMYQAIMYDGNGEDAKIMGIEYIVTEKLFNTIPDDEKKLWHSHHHEVKSGSLIAPGIPQKAEHELMEKLVSTYGKTVHTWHTDQNRTLPVGSPMIMMGFTKEGQLKQELVIDRDKRFNISSEDKKSNRKDIPEPSVDPMANAWERGEVRQLIISNRSDSSLHKHQGIMRKEH